MIQNVGERSQEQVTIECVEVTQEIENLRAYAESVGDSVVGVVDGATVNLPLNDILSIEVVDEKVFAYLEKDVAQVRGRLYEYEERLAEKGFVRVSKSVLLHLSKVSSIRPELSRRLIAEMTNGEQVLISRQYVKPLKEILLGGKINEM